MTLVSARVWSGHHDAIIRAANAKGVSVSAYVRGILTNAISVHNK